MMSRMPVERLTPERRRELTRSALVDAAAEVFATRGFHAASLDEIAEAAGFTRGAIYSNFDGKEDLFLAVLDRFSEQNLGAFVGALEGSSEGSEASAAAGVWSQTMRTDATLTLLSLEMRVYALRNPAFRRRLAEVERKQAERIARFIEEEAGRQGRTLRMPADELAEILRAASDGLSQQAAVDSERMGYFDGVVRRFFELVEETIVTQPRKRPRA